MHTEYSQLDESVAFPHLTDEQLRELEHLPGVERREGVPPGTILFREGDRDFSFYVVLSGEVEIINGYSEPVGHDDRRTESREVRVTVHGPGEFVGDMDVMTQRATVVTARVLTEATLLELPRDVVRHVISDLPDISDVLMRAFHKRRELLMSGDGYEGVKIIGSRFDSGAHRLREFATRNVVPYHWLDVDSDPDAVELLDQLGVSRADTPVVLGRGAPMIKPTIEAFASRLGILEAAAEGLTYDLVIVGAGPAGLGGAVYAASEGLSTLVVDALAAGGQAGTSSKIENYLGFPAGISGTELASVALLQAEKFGATISVPRIARSLHIDGGERVIVMDDDTEVHARSILIASGVEYRRLDVPNLERLEGAGVYYSASQMELGLCSGVEVVVVGGGNSAGQAAMFLSDKARRVHVVIRGDDLRKSMSAYLVERIENADNIEVHRNSQVVALDDDGNQPPRLATVHLRSNDGREEAIEAAALFIFIGAVPHTGWLGRCVALDEKGFVLTGTAIPEPYLQTPAWQAAGRLPYYLETSIPGVFAAGDVRAGSVKRVASAVGEGAMAVTFVHTHLGAAVS